MNTKEAKKFKLSRENATAEFNRIVEAFNFNISSDLKENIVTMNLNGIEMQSKQSAEYIGADSFIQKIMQGKITFDEEKKQIVYHQGNIIKLGETDAIKEFRFGRFTRKMQLASKVPINKCNFQIMSDEEQTALLMAMTGVSDESVFGELDISEFNDLRMIAGYFFN